MTLNNCKKKINGYSSLSTKEKIEHYKDNGDNGDNEGMFIAFAVLAGLYILIFLIFRGVDFFKYSGEPITTYKNHRGKDYMQGISIGSFIVGIVSITLAGIYLDSLDTQKNKKNKKNKKV